MDNIAIILPVHNRKDTTLNCIKQLQTISNKDFEFDVIVIDDGSSDGTCEAIIKSYPHINILKGDGNLWWSGAINVGFKYAITNNYNFVYTLNDDITIFVDTLQVLYDSFKYDRNAVYSSIRMGKQNKYFTAGFEYSGFFKKLKGQVFTLSNYIKDDFIEADSISTKSTLIPVNIIKQVGFFDTKHFPHNYSDFDYFIRVKKEGFKLLINVNSRIYTGNSDSNFHELLLNNDLKKIFRSFFDIKYGNHYKSLYYLSTKREGFLFGHISFLYRLIPYFVWLFLRLVLPNKLLYRIFLITGRVNGTNN